MTVILMLLLNTIILMNNVKVVTRNYEKSCRINALCDPKDSAHLNIEKVVPYLCASPRVHAKIEAMLFVLVSPPFW